MCHDKILKNGCSKGVGKQTLSQNFDILMYAKHFILKDVFHKFTGRWFKD